MSGTSRYDIDIVANNKAAKALGKTANQLKKIDSNAKKSNSALKTMGTLAATAAAALGGIQLARSFLDTAKQFENLGIQLKFITGNAQDGARALGIVEDAATRSAFAMSDMANAAPLLLTVGSVDQLADSLDMVGDIAAATGLDFNTTAEQIQRAFSGGIASADIFREKGIKDMLGFQEGVQYTAEQTEKMIRDAFENGTAKMKGATAEMAKTWTGQVGMMGDKWTHFQKTTMESGLFPALKKELGDLDQFFKDNAEQIDAMAVALGEGLAAAVVTIGEAIAFIAEHSDKFATAAKIIVGLTLAKWAVNAAIAMRGLATGIMAVMAMSGPPGWAAIAGGIVAITAGTLALNKVFGETAESFTADELAKKIEETEARIKALKDENAELETQLGDLGPPLQDLTIDLNDTNNMFKSLEDQVIQIPDAFDHVTTTMSQNSAEAFILEKELEALETMMAATATGSGKVAKRNEELAESFNNVVTGTTGATDEFAEFNKEWAKLKGQLFPVQAEIEKIKAQIDLFTKAIADGHPEADLLAKGLDKMRQRLVELDPEAQKAKETAEEWAQEWSNLQAQLFPTQTRIAELNTLIDTLEQKIAAGEDTTGRMAQAVILFKKELAKLNPETQALIQSMVGYKDGVVRAAEAEERNKKALDDKITSMNSLYAQFNPLATQLAQYQSDIKTLNFLIENNIGNTDKWKKLLIQIKAEMAALNPETQALIASMQGYKDGVVRAAEAEARNRQAIEDKVTQYNRLKETMFPLEAQMKQYQSDIDTLNFLIENNIGNTAEQVRLLEALKTKMTETQNVMSGFTETQRNLDRIRDRLKPLDKAIREHEQVLKDLKKARDADMISMAEYNELVALQGKAFRETTQGMKSDSEKFVEDFNKDFNRKLADGLANGTLSFKTFAGSWKKVLADLINDTLNGGTLLKDILSMFGNAFGGGGGGFNPLSFLTSSPGSKMNTDMMIGATSPLDNHFNRNMLYADGGKIAAGETGIVGEAGAELVTGPATVTPNSEIGGAKPQVNITIQAIDTQSGTEFLIKNKKQIEGIIQHAYNRRGKQGIY